MGMTLADVDRLAVDLGCRRTTRGGRATWLLDGDASAVRAAIEAAAELQRAQSSRS